jgi:hypothetical protein
VEKWHLLLMPFMLQHFILFIGVGAWVLCTLVWLGNLWTAINSLGQCWKSWVPNVYGEGKRCLCPWTIRPSCRTARWVFMSEMARQIATTLLAGWLHLTPGTWPALATSTIPPAVSSDHTLHLRVWVSQWYFVEDKALERNCNLKGNKWRGGILRRK